MANLSDLPNELILMILHHLPPPDVDAFCMLNKTIRALAASFLEQHLNFRRNYTYTQVYSRGNGKCPIDCDGSPANLLAKILQTPRLAFYVRNLYLNGCKRSKASPRERKTARKLCRDAINRCAFAWYQTETDEWIGQLNHWDGPPFIDVLLLMLPGITRLRLNGHGDSPEIDRVLRLILETQNLTGLDQLSTIEFDSVRRMGMDYGDSLMLVPLLPAINRLSARRIAAFEPYDWSDLSPHTMKSTLKHINLVDCNISPCVLSKFLSCATNLNTFKYFTLRGDRDMEPQWLCSSLLYYTQDTLTELTLYSYVDGFLGSLKQFKVLKRVSILVRHLYNPSSQSQSIISQNLPSCLTTLKLRDDGLGLLFHGKLLDDLLQNKSKEVPCLERLSYIFKDEDKTSPHARDTFRYFCERSCLKEGVEVNLSWTPFSHVQHEAEVLGGTGWHLQPGHDEDPNDKSDNDWDREPL